MAVVITGEVMVAAMAAMAAMGMVAMAAAGCLQAAFRPHPLLRRRPWRVRRAALPTRPAHGFVNNAVGP
jgi:uncharacterized membrane protein YedE/YeeE